MYSAYADMRSAIHRTRVTKTEDGLMFTVMNAFRPNCFAAAWKTLKHTFHRHLAPLGARYHQTMIIRMSMYVPHCSVNGYCVTECPSFSVWGQLTETSSWTPLMVSRTSIASNSVRSGPLVRPNHSVATVIDECAHCRVSLQQDRTSVGLGAGECRLPTTWMLM